MCDHHRPLPRVDRRKFLHGVGIAAAGLALASCKPAYKPEAEVILAAPTRPAVANPTVAIARAASYEPKLVRKQVQAVLDGIGGVADILAHGKRVAIKVNLTGGTGTKPLKGVKEIDSYLTHPEVVKALCELLRDAGVTELFLVEAVYEDASWPQYEYTDMAKAVGAKLIDLNYPNPYDDYVQVSPGSQGLAYQSFYLNNLLLELDAFISVSKMKCHATAGVTHTMKNLFGLAPLHIYALNGTDTSRTAFHDRQKGTAEFLPRVIVDLNVARPVHLGLIDGILTTEGGEGPWISSMSPIQPGVLIAGKDPVATDAVATAAMGFDPTAEYPNTPFTHAQNHMNIAAKAGLGTNKLENIKVVGEQIADVKTQFRAVD